MSELLLVGNPARRRAKRGTKRVSAAQRANRARFAAAARARSNPAKRRRHAAHHSALATTHRRRRHAIRRARRNPVSSGGSFTRGIGGRVKSAAMGGAGAFGVDVLYGYLGTYLPSSVQTPVDATGGINFLYYAAKGAAAIGAGLLLNKVIGHSKAAHVVDASLTVTAHDLIKHFAAANLSSVPVGAYTAGGQVVGRLPQANSLRPGALGYSRSAGERNAFATLAPAQQLRQYVGAGAREGIVR